MTHPEVQQKKRLLNEVPHGLGVSEGKMRWDVYIYVSDLRPTLTYSTFETIIDRHKQSE